MTPKRSPRRLGSFRLRTLLIAITGVSLVLGYVAYRIKEGRRQRLAAAELIHLGCLVESSHYEQVPVLPARIAALGVVCMRISTLPAWMEAAGIADALRRIEYVGLEHCANIDEATRIAAALNGVRSVSTGRRTLTAEQVESLASSVSAEALYLEGSQLPRERMPYLDQPQLKWLCVGRTQFSDPAIADLPMSLECFDATRTRISDAGLPGFQRLTGLKSLNLRRTPTTEPEIERLKRAMPGCQIDWEPLEPAP